MAYRGSLLIRMVHGFLMPTVLLLTWWSVRRLPGASFGDGDYFLYYLLMPFVMNLTYCWTVHDIPEEIRNGTLNRHLLMPLHPLWHHVAKSVAFKAVLVSYLLPVIALMGWWFAEFLPPVDLSAGRLFFVGMLLGLAVILRFLMTTVLAATGFWIEHVETLNLTVNAAVWAILGGMVVPLETMPAWIRPLTDALPYRYCLSFPLEVLRGRITPSEILSGAVVGISWSVAFFVTLRLMWRRGLRIYTAYGG